MMLNRQRFIISLVFGALAVDAYPVDYESCGVEHTVTKGPTKVVTLNQGATEMMFALGLADKMVGTAYLDDYIWPKYAVEYSKIPVLAKSYPNETIIMGANPDFLVGSYSSAFGATYSDAGKVKGIFSNSSVGPCKGTGSEWEKKPGEAADTTCRPQLHAAGIATYLLADGCEQMSLRPSAVTEQTVYSEMRALGKIFKVDAEAIIQEMEQDFNAASAMVSREMHGDKLKAIWLDCVGRCCAKDPDVPEVYVGAGQGAPAMLMKEAGLENMYQSKEGNWACVKVSDLVNMKPDVIILVDADWDKALDKLTWLYNDKDFCDMEAVQGARFVQIPFSASTLSPRNGPAALDLAIASLHVRIGSLTAVQKSGVSSFNPAIITKKAKSTKCTLKEDKVKYFNYTDEVSDAPRHSLPRSLALGLGFVTCLPIFIMMPK